MCKNNVDGIPGQKIAVRFQSGRTLLTSHDNDVLKNFCVKNRADFVSFGGITSASNLRELRTAMQRGGLARCRIAARIDSVAALHDLPAILNESDVIIISRGELGAVISPEKMFAVQKHILR